MKTLTNGKDYRNGKLDIEIMIDELKQNFNGMSIKIRKKEKQLQQLEQVANLNTYPSRHFNSFCYDDDDDDGQRTYEEYINLLERLLYDNSSPRPPEDFHANPNTIIESLPTFPIPVEDSDSLREEIDIFPSPDDSIPPGIESDDYDSEGDDNSTSLPEFESFHVDISLLKRRITLMWCKTSPLKRLTFIPPIPPSIWISLHSFSYELLDPILMFLPPFGDRNKDFTICGIMH
ncbi:hypothetical protein Tco_0093731 [Tanacetum coccineum]